MEVLEAALGVGNCESQWPIDASENPARCDHHRLDGAKSPVNNGNISNMNLVPIYNKQRFRTSYDTNQR